MEAHPLKVIATDGVMELVVRQKKVGDAFVWHLACVLHHWVSPRDNLLRGSGPCRRSQQPAGYHVCQ